MKVDVITEDELKEQYNESLNEAGPVRIGTLEYEAARVLEEVDPTAYRCGLNDYADSLSQDGTVCPEYTGDTVHECPECGDTYDDEDEARECCGGDDDADE